jgi:hypothetical protein
VRLAQLGQEVGQRSRVPGLGDRLDRRRSDHAPIAALTAGMMVEP